MDERIIPLKQTLKEQRKRSTNRKRWYLSRYTL
jgi:hypothetical protein